LLSGCGGLTNSVDAGVADDAASDAAADAIMDAVPTCSVGDSANEQCSVGVCSVSCPGTFFLGSEPGCPLNPDSGCVNQCNPNEFAAYCGSGEGTNADPPASTCRAVAAIPIGAVIYCCGCE
jgi:hypothetical protein